MDWTRGRTIGRGSSAAVSVARANGSGELLAVKSVELSKSGFLQREQKILSSLSCPQIIEYKGFSVSSENGELLYNLCLEFAAGGSLSDEIRRRGGRLSEAQIRAHTREILIGLDYLHSAGIVHCDVKGPNVLVTADGLKIADLGCARLSHDDVSGADWVPLGGTPVYMAPEVARGEQQGFAADVWSLGCTVIEMATGRAPWADEFNPVAALYRIGFSDDVPEIPNFVSKQAKDFLGKCLKRNPLERWSASELLGHPFLEGPEFISEFDYSNLDSPKCVLDLDNGCSFSDSEEKNPNPTTTGCPAERIRRLSGANATSFWIMQDWASDEDWITVRDNCTQEEPQSFSHSPENNGFSATEPTNTKGIDTNWTSEEDDLASPTKFSGGLENCKDSSKSNNSFNTRDNLRDWKRGNLRPYKCTEGVLCNCHNFGINKLLRLFMHCPVPYYYYY